MKHLFLNRLPILPIAFILLIESNGVFGGTTVEAGTRSPLGFVWVLVVLGFGFARIVVGKHIGDADSIEAPALEEKVSPGTTSGSIAAPKGRGAIASTSTASTSTMTSAVSIPVMDPSSMGLKVTGLSTKTSGAYNAPGGNGSVGGLSFVDPGGYLKSAPVAGPVPSGSSSNFLTALTAMPGMRAQPSAAPAPSIAAPAPMPMANAIPVPAASSAAAASSNSSSSGGGGGGYMASAGGAQSAQGAQANQGQQGEKGQGQQKQKGQGNGGGGGGGATGGSTGGSTGAFGASVTGPGVPISLVGTPGVEGGGTGTPAPGAGTGWPTKATACPA